MPETPTPDRKATVLLLLAIAGAVDAVGLAELGRYFVAFMGANTTQVGVLLAYRDVAGAVLPLGLAALFTAGATIGTLIADGMRRHAEGVLMLLQALLLVLAIVGLGSPRPALGLVPLPVAMGIGTLVLLREGGWASVAGATGALVRLGAGLAGAGRGVPARGIAVEAGSWAALMLGSLGGALGRLRFGGEVLLAPAAALLLLGGVALVEARRR